jgi:membrane-associated phospholipid phosphatase
LRKILSEMNLRLSKRSVFLEVIGENKIFLVPFAVYISFLSILLMVMGNSGTFLFLNNIHSDLTDFLFPYITRLGNGIIPFILVIILLGVSYREFLSFLAITLLIIILVTILKRVFFADFFRPVAIFPPSAGLHIVLGYNPPSWYSFPSGHSATTFSVFLYMAILSKNNFLKFVLFIAALMVSYSRIYLAAHFPADVIAGSMIAVTITLFGYSMSRKFQNAWIDKKVSFKPKIFVR